MIWCAELVGRRLDWVDAGLFPTHGSVTGGGGSFTELQTEHSLSLLKGRCCNLGQNFVRGENSAIRLVLEPREPSRQSWPPKPASQNTGSHLKCERQAGSHSST
jgi:hypothetical protein